MEILSSPPRCGNRYTAKNVADPIPDPWWSKYLLLVAGWFLGLLTKEFSDRISGWIRGPRVQLGFGETEDCVTLTPEEYYDQRGESAVGTKLKTRVVFFARIKVSNSKPRIARNCQAWLVDVETADEQGGFKPTIFKDSIPLIWSYNAESETVDIPQGINRYVDLVRIQDDVAGFQPQLRSRSGEVLNIHRYEHLFNTNGILRFTVLVSAQEINPEIIRIVVARISTWPPTAELST
jgi:hypothetical protein